MNALAEKRTLLENSGFAYGFDREVYYNLTTKKVFSIEFVEDHTPEELNKCIGEIVEGKDWRFYFNSAPSNSTKHELEEVLG